MNKLKFYNIYKKLYRLKKLIKKFNIIKKKKKNYKIKLRNSKKMMNLQNNTLKD